MKIQVEAPADYLLGNYLVGIFIYLGLIVIVIAELRAIVLGGQPPLALSLAFIAAPYRAVRRFLSQIPCPGPLHRLWLGLLIWWAEEQQLEAERNVGFHRERVAESIAHVGYFAQRRNELIKKLESVE